ncbi:Poly(A) polymerase I [Linum perenne]
MMQSLYQRRHCLLSRLMSLTRSQLQLQRMNHTDVEGRVPAEVFANIHSDSMVTQKKRVYMPKCIKVNAKHFGIKPNQIPDSPLTVLKILRYEGFEAYLVGGCIRDIILDKVPKDFDVITTATLSQINKKFRRSIIIGSRFPICRVVMKGSVIEVSSFETVARHAEGKEKAISSKISTGSRDSVLWRNSMKRDFTINSLFFDPFKNVIYDCANGMEDLRALNLQTVIPARQSFQEDCARILRGLRIAGRLGLSISPDTETAIHELSSSIASLDKMWFAYSVQVNVGTQLHALLWSFGSLYQFATEIQPSWSIFPIPCQFLQAAYLHQQSTGNSPTSSIMVMKLLFYLDRLVSCAQPCSSNLWLVSELESE